MTNKIKELVEASQDYVKNFNKEYPHDSGNYYGRAFIAGANWLEDLRKPVAGSADLDKLAAEYRGTMRPTWTASNHDGVAEYWNEGALMQAFKAGFAAAKLDNLDQPAPPTSDDAVMRMLGSIENRLMEMQNGPSVALAAVYDNVMSELSRMDKGLAPALSRIIDHQMKLFELIGGNHAIVETVSDDVAEILGLMRSDKVEGDTVPDKPKLMWFAQPHDVPPPAIHPACEAYNEKPGLREARDMTPATDESGQSAGFEAKPCGGATWQGLVNLGWNAAGPALMVREKGRTGIIPHPEGAGNLVDMVTLKGQIFAAYENGVYVLKGTTLHPINNL